MRQTGRRLAFAFALAAVVGSSEAAATSPRYDAHTAIVRYADSATPAQRERTGRRAGVRATIGRVVAAGADLVRVAGDPAEVVARLNRSPRVRYAELNHVAGEAATVAPVPNDPLFGDLYYLENTGQEGGTPDADIDAREGWGQNFGPIGFPREETGVKVGIVDTGILRGHREFAGKHIECAGVRNPGGGFELDPAADPTVEAGLCDDDYGHGTHVAGILAARANDGVGVTGVAFNSPLAVCRAEGAPTGGGAVAGIANCITHVSEAGAKIISLSIAGLNYSAALDAAIARASERALLISAAGNEGSPIATSYPAADPHVVMVGATNRHDARASFSNYNHKVEISAPGEAITSTMSDGAYVNLSGTSMSVPQVAGAAALIAGRYPQLGPAGWRAKLQAAVDDLGVPGRDPEFGYGRLNLAKALPFDPSLLGTAADRTPPVISAAAITPRRFFVDPIGTRGARSRTRIRFALSEPAFVTLSFSRAARGQRRVGEGSLRRNVAAGRVTIAFRGRVGGRLLRAGAHVLRIGAQDAAGNRARKATLKLEVRR